jgi:hypothetical protein
VLQQLKQNAASSAFDGYWVELEEEAKGTTCVHTLNEASLNSEFPCTGLAWNCTGSVLGASYPHSLHFLDSHLLPVEPNTLPPLFSSQLA